MKFRLVIIYFLAIILLIACNKTSETNNTKSSLIGRWLLTETLADPGDGSGKWLPVNSNDYHIQFNADSSAEDNNNGTMYGNLIKYSLPSDSTLDLIYADGTTFRHYYKIDGNELTLMGGCIEACGSKYRKLNSY